MKQFVRAFVKGAAPSFGLLAGFYLTLEGHPWQGLYVLLLGIVFVVFDIQYNRAYDSLMRKHLILIGILKEQFGDERTLKLIDEFFISHRIMTPEEIGGSKSENKVEP